MTMPSACLAQPCSVSMLDEEVSPISNFGFTPWRSISLSTPQVVNGCAEIATISGLARFISRTWVENVVSASSHSLCPSTCSPLASACAFMTPNVAFECAKSFSTPPQMVLRSGYWVLSQANSDFYISNSVGTLRNDHSEIFASPPLAATSAMIGNCSPLSEASPTFFCRMPNSDSATFEQVGPTATNASVDAMRRTTEMPSSALQRSSRNSTVNLALLPSPSVTPPALLITSAAAFKAASLLTPNTRTTPDLAPNPVILTVRS